MVLARTPYFLLDRRAGWREGMLERVVIDAAGCDAGALRLRYRPGFQRPLAEPLSDLGGLTAPIGVAVDCAGDVYVLDRSGPAVLRFDPCDCRFVPLACLGGQGAEPRKLRDPRALAVTPRGDLLVADTGNRRVQRFALKESVLRQLIGPFRVMRKDDGGVIVQRAAALRAAAPGCPEVPLPKGIWEPVDVLVRPDNCAIVVVDRANGLLHLFDARGRWKAAWDGAGEDAEPLALPVRVAAGRDGSFHVLQEGKGTVVVLDADGRFREVVKEPSQLAGHFAPAAIAVDDEGTIYLADHASDCVHLVCRARDGTAVHRGPWRGFAGALDAMAFDPHGNAILCEARTRRVSRAVPTAGFESDGVYYSEPLDSRIPRCTWHRVSLTTRVAPGTRVLVHTLTSESPKPMAEVLTLPESRWGTSQVHAVEGEGEWDCLIGSPPGRYCWLRLTLVGNGQDTPVVRDASVYYPRASSIRWLPAIYREDPTSADFLERFLSIFDRVRDGIGDCVTDFAALLDPRSAPVDDRGDFLAWLASWLDLALDRHWPIGARRRLVREAHRLYALRGTPAGLVLHLEIYLGRTPQILEHFRLRRWLFVDYARLAQRSALWGSDIVKRLQLNEQVGIGEGVLMDSDDPLRDPWHVLAHRCTVVVPFAGEPTAAQRQTVERIVAMSTPAHVETTVRLVAPRLRVGVQSFIGVDTLVGVYPSGVHAGQGRLGRGTVLSPSPDEVAPPTMRVGIRARIGSSTMVD
jgi:phage tail-like protein